MRQAEPREGRSKVVASTWDRLSCGLLCDSRFADTAKSELFRTVELLADTGRLKLADAC